LLSLSLRASGSAPAKLPSVLPQPPLAIRKPTPQNNFCLLDVLEFAKLRGPDHQNSPEL
jgi:hypothetical protein